MSDLFHALRLAAAVVTAIVFLAGAVAARGPADTQRTKVKRVATTLAAA